ncbi:hypothetical protein [Scytonema sp. PRP1]
MALKIPRAGAKLPFVGVPKGLSTMPEAIALSTVAGATPYKSLFFYI